MCTPADPECGRSSAVEEYVNHGGHPGQPGLFPIVTVTRLTGVPEMTLRNWEKRYGVPAPARATTGGRRLYSDEDVALVRDLAQRVAGGMPIRKAVAAARAVRQEPERLVASLHAAALSLDVRSVQRDLEEASATFTPKHAWSQIVVPVLRLLGDSWQAGDDTIAAEHLTSSAIVTWLRSLLGGYLPSGGSRAAVACGPDELHELGSMALAAFLAARGTPAVYFGANTPASALEDIRQGMSTGVLCITATLRATADRVTETVLQLAERPGASVLAYGGPGFDAYHARHTELAGHAVYLGASLDAAVACVEALCAEAAPAVD